MKQIIPYLFFPGNCREAMTFYREVFGGELGLTSVGDSSMAENMPPEAKDKIINSQLVIGDLMIMASDALLPDGNVRGSAISICIASESEAELRAAFDKLTVGGSVTCPVAIQFWGDLFGTLTDKFGIDWMFNYRA
jgi:PhnB protein